MAAERDSLAAEYYSASLADGIENHLEGSYNRFNIAAAVAVGRYFDVPDERIRHAIAGYVPDNNRSQRIGTSRNTLVADCYNANPGRACGLRSGIFSPSRSKSVSAGC